jgi:surfactin synthase thioesterase subunit
LIFIRLFSIEAKGSEHFSVQEFIGIFDIRIIKLMKLIIFPFAGGSQYAFNDVKRLLSADVEIIGVDYPGRGKRMVEDVLDEIDQVVEDCYQTLKKELTGDFIFWGHSMGASVAFLLTQKLLNNGDKLPKRLIVSGRNAPSTLNRREKINNYPKDLFIEKLRKLGGTTDEVLLNPDLMEFFEPILRADFKAIENYTPSAFKTLDIPISVWYGSTEDLTKEEIELWQKETSIPIDIKEFEGNHFFLFNNWPLIAELLKAHLQEVKHHQINTSILHE